jgi:hypothetical protein
MAKVCQDFAIFLKKRSTVEEEHAQGIKKLSRGTFELIRRPENRQGSFAQNYEDLTRIHDRMSDHGLQFAMSIHQMSDELQDLAANMERGRKHWKQSGLNAEKRVQDSEAALEKAKARYYSLAEQYDRARTGDRQSGRFGLKGPKSAAQQEEDLYRKVQAADSDYAAKVQATQAQREELKTTLRPQAVTALRELITECDSGLTLQLQKFASLNEQLLLRNGLCVNPLKSQTTNGTTSESRSLRDVAQQIDNEGDFRDYVMTLSNKAGTQSPDIKYERHPALASPKQTQAPQFPQQQSFNGHPPGFSNQAQSPRTPSGGFEQGFRPSQPGQISGVTPYQPNGRDGVQMVGQQNPYGPNQPSPYASNQQNQYAPNQQNQYPSTQHNQFAPGPQNQHPPHQQTQFPQSGLNQYPSNQQVQQPHGPSSYSQNPPSIYANAQLPQLPPIGNLSMSPTEPSSRQDDLGTRPQNNKLGDDSRPGAAHVASPVSPPTSSRNGSMPGVLPGGPTSPYPSDGPSPQAGMARPFGNNRSDIPSSGSNNLAGGPSFGPGSHRSDVPNSGPSVGNRQDLPPAGPQSSGRFQNPQPGQNGNYPQSHAMNVDPRVPGNQPQSYARNVDPRFPGSQQQSHAMNVDPRVPSNQPQSHAMNVDPRVPSNNPRLDTSRQPGINIQNPAMAPSSFGTSSSKSRADGPRPSLPPLKPVFGMSLDELFRRDSSAVPMIVYQCVQAVDLFGLDVEGIYRTSGSAPHIMEMKAIFDNGELPKERRPAVIYGTDQVSPDSSQVDFRNPAAFHHDIASVTTLLKHFLRDLPDPLLTSANYTSFINSAKIDDDVVRRDSLHAIINSLPDPNYATLRVLTLHLQRVAEHAQQNRMTPGNLAICFGPTLMGQQGHSGGPGVGSDIKDAGWQARVVETILNNTFQIFDDDD